MRHAATFAAGLALGALLAILLTSNVTSRAPSAPRPAQADLRHVEAPARTEVPTLRPSATPTTSSGAASATAATDPVPTVALSSTELGARGDRDGPPRGAAGETLALRSDLTDSSTRLRNDAGEAVRKTQASDHANVPATPSPKPTTRPSERLRGVATWYAYRRGQAAAGPRLREALGKGWRGRTVYVNGVPVRLTDYMGTKNRAKVIDLDDGLFRRICGPLSMGVCDVTVRW